MNGEVIKSFLVGLGFGVDEASLAKFNKAITSASLKVAALYATIKVSAAGIFYSISKISAGFEEIGYSLRLVAPAVNKMLILRAAMLDAYRRAGIDLTKVVRQAILFNYALAKTKFALEAVYKSVAARFFPLLTKQLDIFRLKIFANMPRIQAALEGFVKFIFKAFDATVILGERVWSILGRVWEFFKKLDTATDGWSTKILGFIAVWKLLNLSFIATPLGAIITGLLAIVALYDDFKVWQEGGKSFFDWSRAVPTITAVKEVLTQVNAIAFSLLNTFKDMWAGNWGGVIGDLLKIEHAFVAISNAVDRLFRSFNIPIIDKLLAWRDSADNFLGLGNPNANAALNSSQQPTPLIPSNSNSSTRVNQENHTNIYGVPDANGVASSQADVNQQNLANITRTFSGKNLSPRVQ